MNLTYWNKHFLFIDEISCCYESLCNGNFPKSESKVNKKSHSEFWDSTQHKSNKDKNETAEATTETITATTPPETSAQTEPNTMNPNGISTTTIQTSTSESSTETSVEQETSTQTTIPVVPIETTTNMPCGACKVIISLFIVKMCVVSAALL